MPRHIARTAHPPRAIVLTRALAYAAATDAGNRAMRAAGRAAWSVDDYNAAAREFARLWPRERYLEVN